MCVCVCVCVNVVEFSVQSHQHAAIVLCGAVPEVSNPPTVTESTLPLYFYLLDRVINVMPNGAVPYKMKGTVIGIHGGYFK